MIQAVMYFVLGLLAAGLVVLLVTPVLWRRAQRLARRRVEAALPSSRAEINADKDQLRARFAVANRRLEVAIGRLTEKLAGRLIEVGRQKDEITALNRQQAELTATIGALEKRDAELAASFSSAQDRLAAAKAEVALRDERLAARASEIDLLRGEVAKHQQLGEEQRLELVARGTSIDNLTDRLSAAVASEALVVFARDQLSATLASERTRLAEAQVRIQSLEASLAAMQAERTERLAELAGRAEEIEALQADVAAERVQREATLAANEEARGHLADAERRIGVLEAGLVAVRAERADRQAEIERHAAALREREAEVAAERAAREALADKRAQLEAERARLAAALDERASDIAAPRAATNGTANLAPRADQVAAELAEAKSEVATLIVRLESETMAAGEKVREATAAAAEEKAAALARAAALEAELRGLRSENIELRHIAGAEWEADREQNRRLRERLNEIASDVVRLTQTMGKGHAAAATAEDTNGVSHPAVGPDDAAARPAPAKAAPRLPEAPATPGEVRSLGERLRALQHANMRH